MTPYVIWGSKGHALVVAELLRQLPSQVVAVFDSSPDATPVLPGIPLIRGASSIHTWLDQRIVDYPGLSGVVAIGGAKGRDRLLITDQLAASGILLPVLVHERASLSPSCKTGIGIQLLANSVVAANAVIGNASIINHGAILDHESHLGSGCHLAPNATVCGCVRIEENVMVGAGAVVLPNLSIGKNAIVGAGAVVTKNVPPFAIVAGNPAKVIGYQQSDNILKMGDGKC